MTDNKPARHNNAANGERRSKQAALGKELRRVYHETVNETPPDCFMDFLKIAETRAKSTESQGS